MALPYNRREISNSFLSFHYKNLKKKANQTQGKQKENKQGNFNEIENSNTIEKNQKTQKLVLL